MFWKRKRKKPLNKRKEEDKASFRESVHKIAYSTKKMLGFAVKVTPVFTVLFFITIIINSLFPFAISWLNSQVIDELVTLTNSDVPSLERFYQFIGLYIVALVLRNLIRAIRVFADQNMWFIVARELGDTITKKFAHLDIEHYEDPETRNLIQKVKENYGHRPQQFLTQLAYSAWTITSIVSSISILLFFSPAITALIIATAIPEALVSLMFGRRRWGIWDMKGSIRRDYHNTRNHLLSEHSLMELRIFKTRHFFLDKVYNLFSEFQDEQVKIENKRVKLEILSGLLSLVGYGVTFVRLGLSVVSQSITLGQFNFYISSTNRLQNSFDELFNRFSRGYESGLYVYDIFKFLELKDKVLPGTEKLDYKDEPPLIEFKDVFFKYPGTKKYVLKNFNLVINPSEDLAIVGENGAGKTTLVKLLMRFYDVNKGEILIDGKNIRDLDIETWYSYVGALFQNFNFYHFDAKTNIAVGDIDRLKSTKDIKEAAKKAGAHQFISEYEKGYDQILSKAFKDGLNPSKGQKQRIALARVFFKNAPVLILDEPTSAIDPKAEFEIFERLFEFTEKKTVIIISHRFSTVKNAERIIVLDEGKIIEDGTHAELMKIKDGKYKVAFELQKKGYEE